MGEAGKQAEGRMELNTGEGAQGRLSACLVPGVGRAECDSPTEEGEDGPGSGLLSLHVTGTLTYCPRYWLVPGGAVSARPQCIKAAEPQSTERQN